MIRKAIVEDAKEISKLMLRDLAHPHPSFPKPMIENFRKHARIEGIRKEFENPNLIAFVFEKGQRITGFVVGYKEEGKKSFLHYVTGNSKTVMVELVKAFEKECKSLGIKEIKTDTFEFMKSKEVFEEAGFEFFKSETLAPNLEMLWYKKRLIPKK